MRRLYEAGYTRDDLLELYRLIDWLLALPPAEERLFLQDVAVLEEEARMRYISSAERIGREDGLTQGIAQGRQEGQRKALRQVIATRFGGVSLDLEGRIAIADETMLDDLLARAVVVTTADDL